MATMLWTPEDYDAVVRSGLEAQAEVVRDRIIRTRLALRFPNLTPAQVERVMALDPARR